jgi:hypothetical protein
MGRGPSHKKAVSVKPKWAIEQDKFNRGRKYPGCRGTFPDCPGEIKPEIVEPVCKICPIYKQR